MSPEHISVIPNLSEIKYISVLPIRPIFWNSYRPKFNVGQIWNNRNVFRTHWQWLRWVFEFVGSHFHHPMPILLLPYAPSPFCRILDSNFKVYHLMAICTTKFFVARIYYEHYLLFFYKSELEIHLVQWCSKENQNDAIYEVNDLFLTWCFAI